MKKLVARTAFTAAVGMAGLTLLLLSPRPARAEGLNFGCQVNPPGSQIDPDKEQPLLGDDQIDEISLTGFKVDFQGTFYDANNPSGIQVSKQFDPKGLGIAPNPVPTSSRYYVDADNDGNYDMWFGLRLRFNSDATGLEALLLQNFQLPLSPMVDPGTLTIVQAHRVIGLDLVYGRISNSNAWDFHAADLKMAMVLKFTRTDQSTFLSRYEIGVSSPMYIEVSERTFPDTGMVGVGYRSTSAAGNQGHWTALLDATYPSNQNSPSLNRPPLAYSVDVYDTDSNGQVLPPPSQLLALEIGFDHGPKQFALGTNELCKKVPEADFRSRGQISWNRSLQPDGIMNGVTVEIRTGLGAGQVQNGQQLDELDLQASIQQIPERLDWVMRPDAMQILHTGGGGGEGMQFLLNHAVSASLDDTVPANEQTPMVVSGGIFGMPERTVLRADLQEAPTEQPGVFGVEFCPRKNPKVDTAPNGSTVVPFVPCPGPGMSPQTAQARVQNFIDGDQLAAEGIPDDRALGLTTYVVYGLNQNELEACGTQWCVNPNRSAFRFAAQLNRVRTGLAEVDLDADNSALDETRVHITGDLEQVQDVHTLVHIDDRSTRVAELTNTGNLIDVDAIIKDLPKSVEANGVVVPSIDADVRSDSDRPVSLTGRLSAPAAGMKGTVTAQFPGPKAQRLRMQADVTPVPDRIDLSLDRKAKPAINPKRTDSALSWDASLPVAITVGAVISDRDERSLSSRTRMWADADVPAALDASWSIDNEDKLRNAVVTVCPEGDPQCHNDVAVRVVVGPPGREGDMQEVLDFFNANLLIPPQMPDVSGWVGSSAFQAHPEFSSWPAGLGLQALVLPDRWGVDGHVKEVSSVRYDTAGTQSKICLNNQPWIQPDPFVVNVFVADGDQEREQVYADAILTRLPPHLGARIDETAGPASEPLVWFTSEPCASMTSPPTDIPKVPLEDLDTAPAIDAIVRYSNSPSALLDMGKKSGPTITGQPSIVPDPPARPQPWSANGALFRALVRNDGIRLDDGRPGPGQGNAMHAAIREPLPSHLLVWQPLTDRCDDTVPFAQRATCQNNDPYQPDSWTKYGIRYDSGMSHWGPLDGAVRIVDRTTPDDTDLLVEVAVSDIPGELQSSLKLTTNARLPWTSVSLQHTASTVIDQLDIRMHDRVNPAFYRLGANTTQQTSNAALTVRDIGTQLDMTAMLRQAEPKVLPVQSQQPECKRMLSGDQNQVGYVHAVLDLEPSTHDLTLRVAAGFDGGNVVTMDADTPIDVWVNARVDHVVMNVDYCENVIPEVVKFATATAGTLAGGWIVAWPVMLFLLFGGDTSFQADLDMDLPILVDVHHSSAFKVLQKGALLSFDRKDDDGLSQATLAVRQQSLPGEPALTQDGIWYWKGDVYFSAPISWSVIEQRTDQFDDASIHSYDWCLNVSVGCYLNNTVVNQADPGQFPSSVRSYSGWKVSDMVLDPLFGAMNRAGMWARDQSWIQPGRPGGELYKKLAEMTPAPEGHNEFNVPSLGSIVSHGPGTKTFKFTVGHDYYCPGAPDNAGIRLPAKSAPAPDGGWVLVVPACEESREFDGRWVAFGAVAEGFFQGAVGRYTAALTPPPGLDPDGDARCLGSDARYDPDTGDAVGRAPEWTCTVTTTIATQQDGSAQITMDTKAVKGGQTVALGVIRFWFDASGNPFSATRIDGVVPDFQFASTMNVHVGEPVVVDPCDNQNDFLCSFFVQTRTIMWGDGQTVPHTTGTAGHVYTMPGEYMLEIVGQHQLGAVIAKRHVRVVVSP